HIDVRRVALRREITAGPRAKIKLLLRVRIEMREPADSASAERRDKRLLIEVQESGLRRPERCATAWDGCGLAGFIVVTRGLYAFLDCVLRKRIERDHCGVTGVVEHCLEPLIEEWQELLDALAADARADAIVERIAHRAERLSETPSELQHREFV